MRGAPITLRCTCGESVHVPYGERWECPECHKLWDTNQIPAEQYWGIMREMRRLRLVAMGVALAIAVVGLALALVVGSQFIIVSMLVVAFWFIWYMPYWRRKVRSRARHLPTWSLHPCKQGAEKA
jgi:hypothetical protein